MQLYSMVSPRFVALKYETKVIREKTLLRCSASSKYSRHGCIKREKEFSTEFALGRRETMVRQLALGSFGFLLLNSSGVPSTRAAEVAPYDQYADNYDSLNGGTSAQLLGFDELREFLVGQASGDVLEVGVGTGLNLPLYQRAKLQSLTVVDASLGMLDQAAAKSRILPVQPILKLRQASVEHLPFEADMFDTVVDTFSLCVYSEPVAALKEMRRVVRSGGRVLLLEHNRSPNPVLAKYQDLTARTVANMSKGCVYNQDVRDLVEKSGLKVIQITPALGGLIQVVVAGK